MPDHLPLVNLCYDVFHTYAPILYVFAGLMVVVPILFQFAITSAHKDRAAVTKE